MRGIVEIVSFERLSCIFFAHARTFFLLFFSVFFLVFCVSQKIRRRTTEIVYVLGTTTFPYFFLSHLVWCQEEMDS